MSAVVRVLELDADLAAQVPADDRERARRALAVPLLTVEEGPFPLDLPLPEGTCGLLVVAGSVLDESRLAGRELAEIVLPGEVLLPWTPNPSGLASERLLSALETVRLAALDRQFLRACALWPGLMETIHRRINDQEHRVALRGLICQLPRVEQRVVAVLWHLADRMGTVGPDGVSVRMSLTHEHLGRLIGARRPTVSLAVKRLLDTGMLSRRTDGTWILPSAGLGELDGLFAPIPGE